MSEKPCLGIAVEKWLGDAAELMVVGSVHAGGAAEAAGIVAADIIAEIGGLVPVEWLRNGARTGAVRVVLERDGKKVARYLEFPAAPSPSAAPPPIAADPFKNLFADKPTANDAAAEPSDHYVALGRQVAPELRQRIADMRAAQIAPPMSNVKFDYGPPPVRVPSDDPFHAMFGKA